MAEDEKGLFSRVERKAGVSKTGAVPPVGSAATKAFDPTALVESLKKDGMSDVFIADKESLIEVKTWIPMPDEFSKLMSAPGIPCGHVIEAYGPKDSGKTTYATLSLVETQKIGGVAVLLDTEHKFSLKRAAAMGLDVSKLVVVQATSIEEAFEKFGSVIKKIKSNASYRNRPVTIVWDSLGQTASQAELDTTKTDFSMTAAKVIKGELRKVRQMIARENIAFVIINQVYTNMNTFGKRTTPYGGSGPDYAATIILEFKQKSRVRLPKMKSPEPFVGIHVEVECVKNHIGQPFRKLEVDIDHRGFCFGRDVEAAPEE